MASALLGDRDEAAPETASLTLYEALRTAKLLVPIVGSAAESEQGLDLRLVGVDDERGETRLLAFTSERTFGLGGQLPPFAAARATDLCAFALRHGADELSIDSGGPVSATLERWELEALADGRSPRSALTPRPPLTMSAIPRKPAAAVESVLRTAVAGAPVFALQERGDGRRHLVLACAGGPALSEEEMRRRLGPPVSASAIRAPDQLRQHSTSPRPSSAYLPALTMAS